MFNYNISMAIVTISDKIVERILSPQIGYCFETTEKILGPCQPMDATEL